MKEGGFMAIEEKDEKKIIMQAKNNPQAFDYLYEKYFSMIFSYVLLRINNREAAEDIVSVVFYKALKNLGMFRWRQIPFSAWLYRIAYHEICNYAKKEKKHYSISQQIMKEQEGEPAYTLTEEPTYDFIHHYIKQLSEREQEIVILRFFEKKSYPEIAKIIGKNEGNVRVILHRTLKRLESMIPKEVFENVSLQVSL